MKKKKRKLIDKILIIATPVLALCLFIYWWVLKRPDRDFYFQENFSGWVKIVYQVEHAPPLKMKGNTYQITVPDSGIIYTSSHFPDGWGRDNFYQLDKKDTILIPKVVDTDEGSKLRIVGQQFYYTSHQDILFDLPVGTDTILHDGTRIKKVSENKVNYQPGNVGFEYFFLSETPKSINFDPDNRPKDPKELENTKDTYISISQ